MAMFWVFFVTPKELRKKTMQLWILPCQTREAILDSNLPESFKDAEKRRAYNTNLRVNQGSEKVPKNLRSEM